MEGPLQEQLADRNQNGHLHATSVMNLKTACIPLGVCFAISVKPNMSEMYVKGK